MFDHFAGRLYDFFEIHRRFVRIALLLLVAAAVASLFFVNYQSSMNDIMPRDEVVARSMNFLRNSEVTGKVVITFSLAGQEHGLDDLLPVVDRVADSLDRTLFPEVQTGLSEALAAEGMEQMFNRLPGMIAEDDLAWIEQQITREKIAEKLRSTYLQILKPEGMFLGSLVRTDPLGLKTLMFRRLNALAAATGYDVTVRDSHFVSRDGRHAMIIAGSTVPVVDTEGSKKLVAYLQSKLSSLPDFVSVDVISAHSHTVSNERLIRNDLNLIGTLASIGFFILYVLIIRDARSVLIFLVPYIATLFAVPVSALIMGSLSYWVIAMGSTVAGITIDYGSHVYFSTSGRDNPGGIVKQLIKPISFGAFTTVAVFAAFFATGVAGYMQLAVFSIACILFSTFLAIYVLPHFVPRDRPATTGFVRRASEKMDRLHWSSGTMVAVWIALTVVLFYFALQVRFERDIRHVDGTEKEIVQAEERFHEVWGGRKLPAVLVAAAPGYDDALALNERVYRDAVQAVGAENVTSVAPLLPSAETRRENERRWKSFWSPERRSGLQSLLAQEGRKYGFSEHAFDPFFAGLDRASGAGAGPPEELAKRFVRKGEQGYQTLTYFPDTPDMIAAMNRVAERHPGSYLVSGTILSERISAAAARDLRVLAAIAGTLVLIITYFAFWDVRKTVIAMIPPVTSLVWLLGVMAIVDLPINVANMTAGVIVIGLSSDYGIFMSFLDEESEGLGTVFSITLCTVSTIIGAGVLVFAKHPALWSVGATVVIGVTSGYLASLLVVPKLIEFFASPARARAA